MSDSSADPRHGSDRLTGFAHAKVADAMHPGLLSCDPQATLLEVARLMSTHHVHCVVVRGTTDAEGEEARAWGIISDLDLVTAGMRPDGPDTAARVAQQPIVTVETTAPLREAAELMLANRTSHLVAVNPESRYPVGIVSTVDVARLLACEQV